ncbi:tRNA uridine(34) 5-carboxymethylaminomethyl modification radical SAM/GNAT enzyme Elp3 [Patescibacteria group bacterium]|nr:tRNA uridine(34) 5-carboxymethylaminomethyl modification radical SAM/GNAT enzyme Elp3 [Patescibacteria group bacterium]MBU4274387.1 tRNA uridine(34) 5-carboxymethylaminomethyl modification radical SAM/GNAT enzyme Elp3 [Patescibacteria group bacterium]MBU4367505.1 tRNA uridine(34) 5-carboxymethylaminomethyl modification radical SAM/GNAT enzyme Elp3 [Patescibacteria group bacterium]MBU4461546.1 tRNA uridine(34) 5-carboxymethylaminomethyl modification radical SAM/GNAT enzyme Elp3 [Patescibacteri
MKEYLEKQIIVDLIKSRIKDSDDLNVFKRKMSKKFDIPVISNVDLLKSYHSFCQKKRIRPDKFLEKILIKRAIRSLSGVAIVSVLTKPYPCPGKCLYCPTEKGMPKSYLSNEPAVMRAILNKFDPKKQIENRLKSLKLQGHPTDKIELIVIGGTWSYLPKNYQGNFIKNCFDATNGSLSRNLESAQKLNEKAKHRIIGITVETRPDFIDKKEVLRLRQLGVTRVEMGIQSIYDDILRFNLRGHLVKNSIEATKLLKNAGFKVCYHIMPNLPKSDLKKDEKTFKELFSNPDFQPDLLKIYPCAILKEAPLYKLWGEGKYKPYTEKQLTNLLLRIKKQIPYYCRIQRLTRDIPSPSIIVGPAKISNMRQVLAKISKKQGWQCKCIRCREVRENYFPKEKLYLFRQDYSASGGKEIFLSYENKNRNRLYSLLRLRISFENQFIPILKNAAIIRELHTYGQLHPLVYGGRTPIKSPQHKGLGKKLIKKAEEITKKEFGLKKIAVISGVGVRIYYRKLKYKLENTYMIKKLY